MKSKIILVIVIVLIAFAAFQVFVAPTSSNQEATTQQHRLVENLPVEAPPNYVSYSPEAFKEAIQNSTAILFFHADWCPTCRTAEKDIIKNHEELPDDVTILKVDYDVQTDLKKQYSVPVQHVFVQLDNEGNEVIKWRGGGVKTILQNLEI